MSVFAWGNNMHGQLGVRSDGNVNAPKMIASLQSVTNVCKVRVRDIRHANTLYIPLYTHTILRDLHILIPMNSRASNSPHYVSIDGDF